MSAEVGMALSILTVIFELMIVAGLAVAIYGAVRLFVEGRK